MSADEKLSLLARAVAAANRDAANHLYYAGPPVLTGAEGHAWYRRWYRVAWQAARGAYAVQEGRQHEAGQDAA